MSPTSFDIKSLGDGVLYNAIFICILVRLDTTKLLLVVEK